MRQRLRLCPGSEKRTDMLKRIFAGAAAAVLFALLALFPTFADEEAAHAPGGTVTDRASFCAALGGEDVIREETLMLRKDVILDGPIVIAAGEYVLNGAGCSVTKGYAGGHLLSVMDGVSLDLGKKGYVGSDPSLLLTGFDGEDEGSLILVDGDLNVYAGTEICGYSTKEDGGCFRVGGTGMLTLYGGKFSGFRTEGNGGAVYVAENGILNVSGGTVIGCTASRGGAVYLAGRTSLVGGTFQDCKAQQGGGVYLASDQALLGAVCVENCTANDGGGVYAEKGAVLGGVTVKGCGAQRGGGIFLDGNTNSGGFEILNCTAADGAGIYIVGKLQLEQGYFSENAAQENGGCLYIAPSAYVTLNDCTFISGTAKAGGGIWNGGTLDTGCGGLLLCKAEIGSGICSTGKLIFRQSVYVSDTHVVALVSGSEPESGLLTVSGKLTAPVAAKLTLYRTENGEIVPDFTVGRTVMTGSTEDIKDASPRFLLQDGNKKYGVSSDGRLVRVRELPPYLLPALIAAVAVAAVASVTTVVLYRKKHKEEK